MNSEEIEKVRDVINAYLALNDRDRRTFRVNLMTTLIDEHDVHGAVMIARSDINTACLVYNQRTPPQE